VLHANGAYLPPLRRQSEKAFSAQEHFVAEARTRAARQHQLPVAVPTAEK
jgi:hypothetical protein